MAGCSRLLLSLPGKVLTTNGLQLSRRISVATGLCNIPWTQPRTVPSTHLPSIHVAARTLCFTTQPSSLGSQSEVITKVKDEIDNLSPNKVFAVVHISGHQFKVTQNDLIVINRIEADIGEKIFLEKVILAGSENFTLIGTPILSKETVRVLATVTEHTRSAKVIIFKKKRRKNYKRKRGHRQDTTVLRINDIHLSSSDV